MRKSSIFCIMFFLFSGFFVNDLYSGEIIEYHPLPFLTFVDYEIIETNWDQDTVTRSLRVIVQNTSDEILSNVTLRIDSLPNYASITNTETSLGDITPGSIVKTTDTFIITVNTASMENNEFKIIWQVECDLNGEHILDETSVIEYL